MWPQAIFILIFKQSQYKITVDYGNCYKGVITAQVPLLWGIGNKDYIM